MKVSVGVEKQERKEFTVCVVCGKITLPKMASGDEDDDKSETNQLGKEEDKEKSTWQGECRPCGST